MNAPTSPRIAVLGFSLVEMMIAMVIGVVLMLGITQVFMASRAASRLSEGVSRAQENGRFAVDFLERDIRMAGHMGCVNDQAHFVQNRGDPVINYAVTSGSGDPLDFTTSIQGYEAAGTSGNSILTVGGGSVPTGLPASISGLSPAPSKGSDIIVLRFLAAEGVPVSTITQSGSNSVIGVTDTARLARLSEGGIGTPTLFGVADCNQADIFKGSAGASAVTASGVTLRPYSPLAKVYRADSMVYYVGVKANGEPGLRRARADSTGKYVLNEELVDGVENMQLLYGLDSTTDITPSNAPVGSMTVQQPANGVSTATNATGAAQWRRVGMVQVGLVVRSPANAAGGKPTQDAGQLSVLGVAYDQSAANDNRFRTTYEVTIALRNRLFGN